VILFIYFIYQFVRFGTHQFDQARRSCNTERKKKGFDHFIFQKYMGWQRLINERQSKEEDNDSCERERSRLLHPPSYGL